MLTNFGDTLAAAIDVAFRKSAKKYAIDFSHVANKSNLIDLVKANWEDIKPMFNVQDSDIKSFQPTSYGRKNAKKEIKANVIKNAIQDIYNKKKKDENDFFNREAVQDIDTLINTIIELLFSKLDQVIEDDGIEQITANIQGNEYPLIVLETEEEISTPVPQQAFESSELFDDKSDEEGEEQQTTGKPSNIKNKSGLAKARTAQSTEKATTTKTTKPRAAAKPRASTRAVASTGNPIEDALNSNKLLECSATPKAFGIKLGTAEVIPTEVTKDDIPNLSDPIVEQPEDDEDAAANWADQILDIQELILNESIEVERFGYQKKVVRAEPAGKTTKSKEPVEPPTEADIHKFIELSKELNRISSTITSSNDFVYNVVTSGGEYLSYPINNCVCTKIAFTGKTAKDLKLKYTVEISNPKERYAAITKVKKNKANWDPVFDSALNYQKDSDKSITQNWTILSADELTKVRGSKSKKNGATTYLEFDDFIIAITKGASKESFEFFVLANKQIKTAAMRLYFATLEHSELYEKKISKIKVNPYSYLQSDLINTENIYEFNQVKGCKKLVFQQAKFYQMFNLMLIKDKEAFTCGTFTESDNIVAQNKVKLSLELITKPTIDKLSETIFTSFNGYITPDIHNDVKAAINQAVKNLEALESESPIVKSWIKVLRSDAFRAALTEKNKKRFNDTFLECFKHLYCHPESRRMYATVLYPISFLFTPFMLGINDEDVQDRIEGLITGEIKDAKSKVVNNDKLAKFASIFLSAYQELNWTRYLYAKTAKGRSDVILGLSSFIHKFIKNIIEKGAKKDDEDGEDQNETAAEDQVDPNDPDNEEPADDEGDDDDDDVSTFSFKVCRPKA